jgi:tRNA (guanine37-N1)-methyltransferase
VPRLIRAALERAGIADTDRISSGVDVVGDIAIVRLDGFTQREKKEIGEALISEVKNLKVVMEQEGGIGGEFRLRKLRHIAGERRTFTTHRENGCVFRVDVEKTYFSPRLSTERLRVAEEADKRERVLNMFAGVGPFSIVIAKRAGAKVTSCELNGYASRLHEENDRLNKVQDLVEVINADAAELPVMVKGRFDRILMPHPSEADRFIPTALKLARRGGRLVYYRHLPGVDEVEAALALRKELRELLPAGSKSRLRRVRDVGPRWIEMAAEVKLPA